MQEYLQQFDATFEFLEGEIKWLNDQLEIEEDKTEKQKYLKSKQSHERALAILWNTQFSKSKINSWVAKMDKEK